MDDKVEVARLRGRCLQSDAPDYRALYFKLFARTEEVRKLLELR